MKILLDGRLISNKPTGISRYSLEMIKIYQKKFGFENIIVLINNESQQGDFKFFLTKYKPFNIKDFCFLHKDLRKIDFDIYHSLFYVNNFFKLKNKIYITTVHDLMYKVVKNFFGNKIFINFFKRIYFDFIVGKSLKNSDYIISVSETTKKDIKKIFGFESVVVPEGINLMKSNGKKSYILEKESLKPNDFFLYVGNARPHKNLNFLIKCYLKSKSLKKLILCGNPKGFKTKLNNTKIKHLGFINDEDLDVLYKNCSAFIFPSKYEGFGLPILEALNKGAKVLSSTGGALKEFPKEVINYFEPDDESKLIELLKKIESIKIDKRKIKEILRYYSWEDTERQMNKLFKRWFNK